MAAINSHRKRQVYDHELQRRSRNYGLGNSPSGASTMMPSKSMRGDDYTSRYREFVDLNQKLSRTFLGNTLKQEHIRDHSTGNLISKDVFMTMPAGMVNSADRYSPFRHHNSNGNSNIPMIYMAEYSGAGGVIGYSRKSTGLVLNGSNSYKRTSKGGNYQYVMSPGDYIGGNIKGRATAFYWVGGMWRAKK